MTLSQSSAVRNQGIVDQTLELDGPGAAEKSLTYAYGLIIVVATILLFGLTMLYSTSYNTEGTKYFYQQLFWTGIGMGTGLVIFTIGYQKLASWSTQLLLGVMILLFIAGFFMREVNGANRWIFISLGPLKMSLQPSELAKPFLVLYLAKYLADNLRSVNYFFAPRGLLRMLILPGATMLLVLCGKDLGTTLLLAAVSAVMMFAGGVKLRWLVPVPLSLLVGGYFYIKNFDAMRWARITSFLDPETMQADDGYQLWSSLLALGSGNYFGLGFMESRMKAQYLPEKHTDFILSIVGEELGFVAMCLVLLSYLAFAYFALKISLNSRSRQGMLLGFGITMIIVLQAGINVAVISGGLPTKGIPAPLISYGGSNLLMSMICLALLLNVAAETVMPGFNRDLHESIRLRWQKLLGKTVENS